MSSHTEDMIFVYFCLNKQQTKYKNIKKMTHMSKAEKKEKKFKLVFPSSPYFTGKY